MKLLEKGSALIGELAEGCRICRNGAKMVLLITGKCPANCFYCPLSERKKGKNIIYANERPIKKDNEIIFEAEKMDAEGTGITGGEPMSVPKRCIKYIIMLKKYFGDRHHIHMYTSGKYPLGKIKEIADARLDEIRFHVSLKDYTKLERSAIGRRIYEAINTKMSVGIEVPAIPSYGRELLKMIYSAEKMGVQFININELEYSETNYEKLNSMGFTVKNDISSAVLGSEDTAMFVIENYDGSMNIHYCTSAYKDAVQLRNRLLRTAVNVAKEYEVITHDGTLLRGLIETDNPKKVMEKLKKDFQVPEALMEYDGKIIRIAPWILEDIAFLIDGKCYIVELYPTADELEVEREIL